MWTRDPETTVLGALRELGVGLVAYSPLGRGFLAGTVDVDSLGAENARRRLPRFAAEAARANTSIAEARQVTAAQVALAWVSAQAPRLGVPVVPIPGTKNAHRLEQNAAALDAGLSAEDLTTLDALAGQVVDARY
ncbi:hypothetical protein GCM10027176_23310 [Actinoallomurus bryophytorum]